MMDTQSQIEILAMNSGRSQEEVMQDLEKLNRAFSSEEFKKEFNDKYLKDTIHIESNKKPLPKLGGVFAKRDKFGYKK